jgi:hypothetical protein
MSSLTALSNTASGAAGPWTKPLARQWCLWLAFGIDLKMVHLAAGISV